MEAGVLKCPMCGATVSDDLPNCSHCGARLAKVACPACFGMIFEGSKFCPHCGAAVSRTLEAPTNLGCPRCDREKLSRVLLAKTPVDECSICHGLWVQMEVFQRICADQEKQVAILGTANQLPQAGRTFEMNVRYLRCPLCRDLMNRMNFAKCSGVIVDVCRGHGTWFDRDELQNIIEFIRGGGLEIAREKEKMELESARRRLEAARSRTREFGGCDHIPQSSWGHVDSFNIGEFLLEAGSSLFDHLSRR